ncbi:hypothetical protein DFP92_101145 [Yoonia sediminilitoris]|uniref:Uncharacterized protein n=1 Tax=Yoonia sediminilitoris TaxID=1286148 RepID=A0A2T6KPS7_9RHOB|nr:hypothetical protein C8N45_101145 [Yoonia sediminilitoris]RCW98729.1 hypothetical protein DFP92_101145 [Yoonia sediminilitoris]
MLRDTIETRAVCWPAEPGNLSFGDTMNRNNESPWCKLFILLGVTVKDSSYLAADSSF